MGIVRSAVIAVCTAWTAGAFGAEPTLREASWFWGHEPGQVDGPGNSFKVPVGKERALSMTDAARTFGVPGLSVIRYAAPGTNAAAVAEFASVPRLAWMASSCYSDERLNRTMANGAIEGAARMPNLVGLDLDDYFLQFGEALTNDVSTGRPVKVRRGVFSLAELEDVVRRAHAAPRPLDVRAVVYCDLEPAQVVPEAKPVLDRVDTVMFWTWNASNLVQLAKNYETCRKLAPGKRFLLGLYLWDFGGKREVTDAEMRIQLDFALEKFRAGELDGVVFHCTPLVNKGLRAVRLAKEWLDRNGDVRFGSAEPKVVSRSELWNGRRTVYRFRGREAWVIEPKTPAEGRPWTWTVQWWGAFVPRTAVPDMIAAGAHHVVLDMFDTRARTDADLATMAAWQAFVVKRYGLCPKARLIGMSWGGFFSTRYAAKYPRNVGWIYYDCPLLNFDRFANPDYGTIGGWAYDLPKGGSWSDDPRMPVNLAGVIAKAGIRTMIAYGGQDQTVPPSLNSALFIPRLKAAGAEPVVRFRSAYGHHPHGMEIGERTIPDFFEIKLSEIKQR